MLGTVLKHWLQGMKMKMSENLQPNVCGDSGKNVMLEVQSMHDFVKVLQKKFHSLRLYLR